MGGRRSAAHNHALEVLGTTWHPYEWALWEVAKGVPPNLAIRQVEEDRITQYMNEHPGVPRSAVPPRARTASTDYLIKVGARSIARRVLQNEAFEHVKHRETGQRLVRVFPVKAPTPPPEGYEHYRKRRSKFEGWTKEQIDKYQAERGQKAAATRLRQQGLDPNTHKTKAQLARKRKEWWANASEEEKAKKRSEGSLKSWETRRRRQAKG